MQVRATVIPRFTIGGRITFRNMTAFVFEDADYNFPKSHFQVEGVLGYPALSALGSLTITADDTIEVRPFKSQDKSVKEDPPSAGARFFLDGNRMIVALGKTGEERMYVVDASSQQTFLTSRYYDEHSADFAGLKMQLFTLPGHESSPPQPAFVAETIPLAVGPPLSMSTTSRCSRSPSAQPLLTMYMASWAGCSRSVTRLHLRLPDHALQRKAGVASQRRIP